MRRWWGRGHDLNGTASILERVDELKLNTATASRIQQLVQGHASTHEIRDVVGVDPILASRLLKLANSAQYGSPRAITDLSEALNRIGLLGTRDMAWALALHALGKDETPHGPALQRHGIEVAAGCRVLAQGFRKIPASNAFVVGLLHDIGAQLFLTLDPVPYKAQLDRYGMDDIRLYMEEKKLFGVDHATVGRLAMQKWLLPQKLADAVGMHHTVRAHNRGVPDPKLQLAALVHMAEELVHVFRDVGIVRDRKEQAAIGERLAAHPVNKILRILPQRYAAAMDNLPDECARLQGIMDG